MSECVNPIDDYSSTLTTTVANDTTNTSVTKSDTDGTKSGTTSLGNCCNDNNDLLMNQSLRSGRHKYVIVDGKRIRSALAGRGRKEKRRVCFPDDDKDLVTGYLEPANPWEHAEDVSRDILLSSYKESCERHCAEPLKKVLDQLEELDICNGRCDDFSLKDESLLKKHCEPLEELFKRMQFRKIDLEHSGLTDESAETLFDMIEYYESAKHVNISNNGNIGTRGWQACGQMIKKTLCLEQLDAKSIVLTQQHMNILRRPLQLVSHLQIFKVENCGLAGRAFVILVAALKTNTGLKELYLADNNLNQDDAIQLGSLLRVNNCLQLLDISNNDVKDEGVRYILEGLNSQSSESGSSRGLKILILWNNHMSKNCSGYFAATIAQSKSLETLNIGHNTLSDDFLDICKDALKHNTVLLQLGVQATGLMNKGIMALAEVVGKNETLQRIDLRDNHIQLTGLTFLCLAMKRNVTITQIDLDEKTWSKAPSMMETYLTIVSEIRSYCARNDEPLSTDSSTEESGSPQHRSRLSSVNSRKISLTCQTLPRSPSVLTGAGDTNVRTTMLEPKRTTGGRLRSPAPSPIPSPVASPIPSPSRSRFVVSRVSEASLSSTNSSASSSPITPPSLASSSTCFFPATSSGSSSRFRVTVVKSNAPPSPTIKNVVSANTNVTIGFNYEVDMPERIDSDDSDSVFRSEEEDSRRGSESSVDADSDERVRSPDSGTVFDVDTTITTSTGFLHVSINSSGEEIPKSDDLLSKDNLPVMAIADDSPAAISDDLQESSVNRTLTQALEPLVLPDREPDEPKITDVPKQSSLDRLLDLFQNPGTLFTGAFVDKNEVPMKNSLQGSVTSMMALGDKFHQYLRDSTRQPLQRSISDTCKSSVSKSDPIKSLSVDQLLSVESADPGAKPQDSVDGMQEHTRRLSGVQEDDTELDNSRVDPSTQDEPVKNALQGSVTSMFALGDKFHQYLKDSARHPLQRSISDASKSSVSKSDPVKSLSVNRSLSVESADSAVRPQNSVDGTQEHTRRLSGVQEDDTEVDNSQVDPSTRDEPVKNALQGSVTSLMALEDKFHQYLKDSTRQPPQESISDTSKISVRETDPIESLSIDQLLTIELADSGVTPQDAVVEAQERTRRLSGVLVDDPQLDKSRVDPSTRDNLVVDTSLIELGDYGNGGTSVPVLTYKSEYSIMIGNCEGVIVDKVSDSLQTICDNRTDDSINSCILRDTIVFPIVGGGGEPTEADDVHNLGDEEGVEKVTRDFKLLGVRESNNNGESGNLGASDCCFDDNCNRGIESARSVEEDVEDILTAILDSVLMAEDKVNFIDFERDPETWSTSLEERGGEVQEDNVVVKVSHVQTLADDLISDDNFGNLGSRSSSFVEDLENPQASRSPTNLFIDKSSNVHRNSQDSGIEEANVSISDDNLETSPQIRDSFQESLDSGIDSECSSVCTRAENAQSFKDSEDKFYDIPEINDQAQSISQSIMIKTSVFVNNGEVHEEIIRTDSQIIGDTDMTIIGAKLSHEEQMVSSSTSVE